jgi:hypothetical protein
LKLKEYDIAAKVLQNTHKIVTDAEELHQKSEEEMKKVQDL